MWLNHCLDKREGIEDRLRWFDLLKPWLSIDLYREESRRKDTGRINVEYERQVEEMQSDTWDQEVSSEPSSSSPEPVLGTDLDKGIVLEVMQDA